MTLAGRLSPARRRPAARRRTPASVSSKHVPAVRRPHDERALDELIQGERHRRGVHAADRRRVGHRERSGEHRQVGERSLQGARRAVRTTTTPPHSTNRGGRTCGSRTTAAGSDDRARPRPRRRRACAAGPRPARWPAGARRAGGRSRRSPPAPPDPGRSRAPPRAPARRTTARPDRRPPQSAGSAPRTTARRARAGAPCWSRPPSRAGTCASRCSTRLAIGSRTCSQLSSSNTISMSASTAPTRSASPTSGTAVDRQRRRDDIDGRLLGGRRQLAHHDRPIGAGVAESDADLDRACGSCPLPPDRSSVTRRWVSTHRRAPRRRGRRGRRAT